MATTLLHPDFKEFLRLLDSRQVDYLLIGGYAVGYHGYTRATADMDIWVAIHPGNAEKLVAVIREFGFGVEALSAELFLKENNVVRMGVPPFRIEVLTTISGVHFEECHQARIADTLDGVPVKIINLGHLKLNKKARGRLKDLADLENLP